MCDFSRYGVPSEEWLRVEATLPTPQDQSVEELKNTTNAGREAVAKKEMELLANKVTTHDHSVLTRDGYKLEVRSYRPTAAATNEALPIYIHFHGGGFLFGTLGTEDASCSRIAINVGVVVVNVNYRHTPEYTYPTAWNDSEDALIWISNNASLLGGDRHRVVIGGVSAGGRLTASLVQKAFRSELNFESPPTILGQVLLIPGLVSKACYELHMKQIRDPSISSYHQCAEAPLLDSRRRKLFNDLLKVEGEHQTSQRYNPGLVKPEEARRLPATTFGIAGNDPLRDEGILYGKLLADNGVPTNIHVFKGVPHGFRRFGEKLSVSKEYDAVIEEGIRWALTKPSTSAPFIVQEH
ncbi:hypothetical protein H2200_010287 [Cladophialophora chaetospira]|uniref:Alpha/beta hydrolase fold-3 domain-containing protein n=1 Tax=Cladophialophora chaetospira TaxID=386627 RepID=A0AA39CE30_9EURO|nr:hypothetical protein H2200_010287 [Cladophialophora chaetospira]